MKNKAKTNYWIDIVIAIAFLLSIVSGMVLYLGPSGGYQGGRNPAHGATVLFLDHHAWSELHTWSSIAMAAGVLAHLILHWTWLICMTKKLFQRKRTIKTAACPNPTI
jgi:hypothetical protein